MSVLLAPDLPQIERELDGLLDRNGAANVLGMCSPVRRAWPESIERRGRHFRLAWCQSELEIREQLERAEDEQSGIVVLTPLDTASLSADVLARLPRGRLEQTDRWTALRAAFRARDVDPRLRSHGWLADLLLARAPSAGYPPAPGGLVDLDSAWSSLQDHVLGLPEGRVDAAALLTWTLDVAALDRYASLPEAARDAVSERLKDFGGPGAGHILAAASSGRGPDALPAALVCGVIFAEDARPSFRESAIRLEPFLGGLEIDDRTGRTLAAAARRVLMRMSSTDASIVRSVQARAAVLLADVRAEGAAALSPALEIGLEARLREAAQAIDGALTTRRLDDVRYAWDLAQRVIAHDRADDAWPRVTRMLMAARLTRWLMLEPARASPLDAAAAGYAAHDSFADWARQALRAGDPLPDVAQTYAKLRAAAMTRREEYNRNFAAALMAWNEEGAPGHEPLPVEKILDHVVGPLAREAPVLLLVLDGLSFTVWHALAETVSRLGWTPLRPVRRRAPLVGVTAIPSVTQISRASLLCGTLTRGDQNRERTGFARHGALIAASRPRQPPRLFHKADLGQGPELEPSVRDAVADPTQRVVGIVHNAVDAQLSGSDQLDLTWSADGLRQVSSLLRIARDAGRLLIVTSDHGHVLDEGTTLVAGGAGDRWREAGQVGEGEIALSGGRVLSPSGGHSVVAAWSESIRFAGRHAGYHGGVSPQEVLIPIVVLTARQELPRNWEAAPPQEPAWWRGVDEEAPMQTGGYIPVSEEPRPAVAPSTPDLFSRVEQQPSASASEAPGNTGPAWIAALTRTEAYAAQRRIAGRGAPPDEQIRLLLAAVAARGGRITSAGLAQALGMPPLRVGGLVNATRRVLNLDQAQILWIDGAEVVLDERLLRRQFNLAGVQ